MQHEKSPSEFHTLKGYQLLDDTKLTYAMEDYLEMICRIYKISGKIRLTDISQNLNVKPSSASKMVGQLNSLGYLHSEKYGAIALTEKGMAVGNYLLYRHQTINDFLCLLNGSVSQLDETEKIEHFLSRETVDNLSHLTSTLKKRK